MGTYPSPIMSEKGNIRRDRKLLTRFGSGAASIGQAATNVPGGDRLYLYMHGGYQARKDSPSACLREGCIHRRPVIMVLFLTQDFAPRALLGGSAEYITAAREHKAATRIRAYTAPDLSTKYLPQEVPRSARVLHDARKGRRPARARRIACMLPGVTHVFTAYGAEGGIPPDVRGMRLR